MDEIRITGLKIYAHHGVYPVETMTGQNFIVNATLYVENGNAGESDDLDETTNYAEVIQVITDEMTQQSFKLIEAAAEHVARRILIAFPLCKAVDLEICKPEAPIPAQFESVSVKIHRKRHHVYLGVGSNLGKKDELIEEAVSCIRMNEYFQNVRCSKVITTKPYGPVEQPDFRNAVIEADTILSPMKLLDYLHLVEAEAGRVRLEHWGPRTLDLDILFYDDLVLRSEVLTIPHADLHNRDFVLEPMLELAPELIHPVLGRSIRELYSELPER